MRICLCIDKLSNGGAERVISTLANQFVLMNHDIFLIETSTKKWDCFYQLNDAIKHIFLLDHLTKNSNINKVKILRKYLKSISPDVVISFKYQTNINVFLANINLGIPHIVSERNNPFSYNIGLSSKLLKRFIFKHSSGCVFQTIDASKYYFKKTTDKSIIIGNPIRLNVSSFPDSLNRNNTILYVGRLEEQKNVKLLIDAFNNVFSEHRDLMLKIYGSGNLESSLKSYVLSLFCKNNVKFMGTSKTWHEDEKESKLFVLPSNYEGMPNSLMEAMALGIPCVSTDCPIGGPRTLIENGVNGVLIPCGDVKALENAMLDLIENKDKCELIARQNRNMYKQYSAESIAKQWIDFVEKILRK